MGNPTEAVHPMLPEHIAIVRSGNVSKVHAYHFHSFADLAQIVGLQQLESCCLFSDLTLGAWRGHWVGRELAQQLGIAEPGCIQPVLYQSESEPADYADLVGVLIDNEGGGDCNLMTAYALARELIAQMLAKNVRHVFIAAPLAAKSWGMENVQLIRFMADAALQYGFEVAVLLRADAELPSLPGLEFVLKNAPAKRTYPGRCLPIPGIVDLASIGSEYAGIEYLQLRSGGAYISPNCRALPVNGIETSVSEPHLQVYFALHGGKQDVDFLQRQAGLRFSEGAYELALEILDGIDRSHLSALQSALIEAQKQNILIALMDFQRAAQGAIPDEYLPAVVKASLYQSKAWGLVMTGQAETAEPYFALAREHLDPIAYRRLYLYLLNISALNKLRLGQIDQALEYEKDIESQLVQSPAPDWHLIYINCMNQARIFKKLKDFEQAEIYYHRAFFVNFQLRNESDLLYANLCLAQLEDMRGNFPEAMVCWLRACVHWLSNPLPEALAPRVAQAVLGKPLSNREANVELISAALGQMLEAAAQKIGLRFEPAPRTIPFSRISPDCRAELCVAQPGWSIFASHADQGKTLVFTGHAYASLNKLVVGLVESHFPHIKLDQFNSLFTDDQCGLELPAHPRELYWSCLKWQVPELLYDGKFYQVTTDHEALIGEFVVDHGRAVNYVLTDTPRWQVHFKRYLKALTLSEMEMRYLDQIRVPTTLRELSNALNSDVLSCMHEVNQLLEKRLVSVS